MALAGVPISVDGKHIVVNVFATAVTGKKQGSLEWTNALSRLERRRAVKPPTTKGKVEGQRQSMWLLQPQYVAQAARALLRAPEQFFRDEACKSALKELMTRAGAEDLSSVDRVAEEIDRDLAEKAAQREAMLDLPAFQNHPAMRMRTHKEDGVLYGSNFDLLRWAGLDDAYHHDWHHWAKAEFQ